MNRQGGEAAAVIVGLGFLGALAWSMTNYSYDIWGAALLAPIYGLIGFVLLRRMFRYELNPVAVALSWGMVIKLLGAFARYWVGFEAYDGSIDAGRYHAFAREQATEIWSGERPWLDAIPSGTGTEFVDEFAAFVYTLTGTSQLGGFVTFSFLAFIGIACFVKAAHIAIPGLATKKYAWLCVLAPSLVYWPSSIGKEAVVICGLGVGSYGIARLLVDRAWFSAISIMIIGLGFTGLIRPHMAGIWVAATLPGLVLAVVLGARAPGRSRGRFGIVVVLGIAAAVFGVIATLTIRFLQPPGDDTGSVTNIIEETARRTSQAGSNFTPPSVSNPLNWPYAIIRTITRPLPMEASGLAQLVSAAEMLALLALIAISWKRFRRLPKLMFTNPYVLFAVAAISLAGLAYTSFANLGVLTRQKSLIFPLLALLACLPRSDQSSDEVEETEAMPDVETPLPPLSLVAPPAAKQGVVAGSERGSDDFDLDEFWTEQVR
jgi:hypothetical protein